jgi:hypothetical protein
MDIIQTPAISAAEARRQAQIHEQLARESRVQGRGQWVRGFLRGVGHLFIFIVIASVLAAAFIYRDEIQRVASHGITQVMNRVQAARESDPLRRAAIDYENQVESVSN